MFLPFRANEEVIDLYAPMKSAPSDAASNAFYNGGPGQLTHYIGTPELGEEFARCLDFANGFTTTVLTDTDECFEAVSRDNRIGRSISVVSTNDVTAVLIAEARVQNARQAMLDFSEIAGCPQ